MSLLQEDNADEKGTTRKGRVVGGEEAGGGVGEVDEDEERMRRILKGNLQNTFSKVLCIVKFV
jgi:hypothetical protein